MCIIAILVGAITSCFNMKQGDSKEELLGSVHNIARQDYCVDAPVEVALTPQEKRFLLVAERGDCATVRKMLDELKDQPEVFNINCVDPLNRSSLIAAIENENIELINILLEYNIQVKDALLHAIKEEYVEAVEILLEWEEKIHVHGQPYSWEAVDRSSSTFTPDITPLILAAHMNNYEILKILLDRGATLPMPHDVRCGCDECVASSEHDSLRHSQARINAYRALSSPSLIALSSRDPLLTAFELSWELRRLSTMEAEFRADYNEMRAIVQQFATSLLDQTRTSYELEVLLNHNPGGDVWQPGERQSLERLKLGIKYKQKEFVAHPSVQQLLAARWYEGLPGFRRKNMIAQMFEVGKMGAMFAMHSTMYIMAPESEVGKFIKKPFVKFICHSASYGFFLMLLALASQRAEYLAIEWFGPDWMQEILIEWKRKERGSMPTLIESGIIFYIISLVWGEMRALWSDGLMEYITDLWNIVDFLNNIFYMLWIFLRFTAWFLVQKELSLGMDPCFLKLVHIFSVNPHLGPLQISLGRMIIDIIKFFFIYTLVLFAFGCGLNQLLWYYADLERAKCYHLRDDYPDFDGQDKALFETSQSLFWASFGLVDLTAFDLTGIKNFTRFWALLLFGSYSVINIIVLLNMLIAMMSNSYQIISERSDTEWKFARSTLWISYFEEGDTVPPPFNMFPSVKSLKRMLGLSKKEKSGSIINKSREKAQERHDLVVRLLIRRYVVAEQRKRDQFGITEDDVMEIRQDISTVRFELIDILRNNGMKTPKLDQENITGKKGRVMERRLLKDFQIGMVEGIINDAISADKGGKDVFSKIAKAIGRKATGAGSKKKDWNAIAKQKSMKRDPIGSSSEAQIRRSRQSLRRHIIENQGSALTSMDPEKLIEYNPKLSEMPPSARVAYAKFKMPKIRQEFADKIADRKSLADDVFADGAVTVNEKTPQGSIVRPRPKPPSRTTSITSQKLPAPEDIKKLAEEKDFRSRTPIPEDPNERRTPTPEPASAKTEIKPVTAAGPVLKPPETKVQPPTPTKSPAPPPPDAKPLTPTPSVTKPAAPKPSPADKQPPKPAAAVEKPKPAEKAATAGDKDETKSTSTKAVEPSEKAAARVTKPGGKSKVTGEVLTGWL
ncbi:hypothetical protein M8J76_000521 [Diaphorina citri]|nr:hypothetical protein M8J76_000521 [Diaphorina citri]